VERRPSACRIRSTLSVPVPLPIVTKRLLIRSFIPTIDCEPMLAVYGDDAVMRHIPGGALEGIEVVRSMLERYASAHDRQGFSSWAIIERERGRVIGDVGFGIFEPTGDVELGYTLAREFWGRGYATEAARACLQAGFAHLDVPRIVAVVEEANEASLLVAERIGMERLDWIQVHGRPHVLFVARRLDGLEFRRLRGLVVS
jgi:[ribosomal protein S5]-alanine N-acetyltransferase